MKKMNKKGFTIVELVIVIAVIAILAAVMIPTFSGVVTNAKEAAALQEARNVYAEYLADYDYMSATPAMTKGYIEVDGYYFKIDNGALNTTPVDAAPDGYSPIQ